MALSNETLHHGDLLSGALAQQGCCSLGVIVISKTPETTSSRSSSFISVYELIVWWYGSLHAITPIMLLITYTKLITNI